jgi:hypothetical protein
MIDHHWRILTRWFGWVVCVKCGLVRLNNEATRRARCAP